MHRALELQMNIENIRTTREIFFLSIYSLLDLLLNSLRDYLLT